MVPKHSRHFLMIYIKALAVKTLINVCILMFKSLACVNQMPVFAQVRGGPSSNIIAFGSPIYFLSVQISAIFR